VNGNPNPALEEMREKLRIWEFFGSAEEGIFVEVGANDPKSLSQTWFLEKMGWRGVLVEPLPDLAEALRRERPNSMVFEAAVSAPEKTGEADFHVAGAFSSLDQNVKDNAVEYGTVLRVKVVTLDSILEEAKIRKVDFLSVDTEGTEVDVFLGFDFGRYRPALVLVEDAVFGLKLHRHMESSRYRLVRRTGFNNWYVPEDSPFRPSLYEKFRLFRKMYLGTPVRVLKFRLQSMRARRGS
jgi:FkbM family methyltransferase